MQITEQARVMLAEILKENEADGIQAVLSMGCCGMQPMFQMVRFDETDRPEVIDGISVVYAQGAKEAVEDVIIDVQNGELVILHPVMAGGCGCHGHEGGCCHEEHDHDHDHECCGGHGEGGCCHH